MKKIQKFILPFLIVLSMGFTFMNFLACEKEEEGGNECDECTNDTDCNDGMTCETFWSNAMKYELCASSYTKECDVPY